MNLPSLLVPRQSPSAVVLLIVALLMFSVFSCNEVLPVYQEPEVLLKATIEGEYWLSVDDHSLRFYVEITNTFDETLEAKAQLTGSVVAFFARDTTIRKTFLLTSSNILSGNYSPDATLRIDPGKSVVLKAVWQFSGDKVVDDSGRDLAFRGEGLPTFFSFVTDQTCESRRFARPEDLIVRATVTVFNGKAPVTAGPTVYPFCFVSNFVEVNVCPRVITVPPCGNWPH